MVNTARCPRFTLATQWSVRLISLISFPFFVKPVDQVDLNEPVLALNSKYKRFDVSDC